MNNPRDRVSQEYVAIRVRVAPPLNAVEVLEDSGEILAVVPAVSLSGEELAGALPALTIPGSNSFEIATGAIVVRWTDTASDCAELLRKAGVELVRDYGGGGVVVATDQSSVFDVADRIARLDSIKSASIHTIRRSARR